MSNRDSIIQGFVFVGAAVIFALTLGLDCLQASGLSMPLRLESVCSFKLGDDSIIVKVLGWSLLFLFLAVLGGPVLLGIANQFSQKQAKLPQSEA